MGSFVTKIAPQTLYESDEFENDVGRVNFFTGTPKYRKMDDEYDPRSVTLEIKRTPLWLPFRKSDDGTPVTTNREKKLDVKTVFSEDSVLDVSSEAEVSNELISLDDSVDSNSLRPLPPSPIMDELREKLKQIQVSPDVRSENVSTPDKVISGLQLKNKFFTPDPKKLIHSSPLNKERTPLGTVNRNILGGQIGSGGGGNKGWKVPDEERARRCLLTENTPPMKHLPPFGSPRSAPAVRRIL